MLTKLSRAVSFGIFAAIVLSVTGAVHYYIWARLVRDLGLTPLVHRLLSGVAILLFASVPLTFWLARTLPPDKARPLLLVAFSWLGMMFFLLVLLITSDVARTLTELVQRFFLQAPPLDPERRVTLSRLLGAGIAIVAGGMGLLAVRSGLGKVLVREVHVELERLPPVLHGLSIVQLSDLHVGPTIGQDFTEEIVRRTNQLEPDVIAITGDLVDGSVAQLRDAIAPLAKLRARYGVYFVTGNHEYYSGVDAWCRELSRLGIRVLRNERVSIGSEQGSFDLAGIDDFSARQFGRGHGPNLPKALLGRDTRRELVLLAHQPRAIHEAERLGVGLQLSGHTHGGQLWPWNYLVRLQQPVVSGLARVGRSAIYVSNGTGYWGPPMRLGAPAEITRLILAAPAAAARVAHAA